MKAKKKDKALSLAIHELKFSVFEEQDTKRRVGGTMSFHVKRMLDSAVVKEYDISFPVLSLWQLPHLPLAVKAHVILKETNGMHLWFRNDIRQIGEVKIGTSVSGMSAVECSFVLDQRILQYGQSSSKAGHISYKDDSSGKAFRIYESKGKAILDILDVISINRAIGGKKRVNFSNVPDEVLEGVGFTKMPDMMGVGIPMWCGDPESIVALHDSWDHLAKEKSVANTMSFLNIVQSAIGV